MMKEDHRIHYFYRDYKGVKLSCILLVMILVPQACIEPFNPDIEEEPRIISIVGSLIKGDSIQQISVHRTATLKYPKPLFVEGCVVKVVDELSNEFLYADDGDGNYSATIPDEALLIDRNYKLHVIVPDGNIYESDFERLFLNSEVDSVYYEVEERTRTYTDFDYWGIQYYVDIVAPDTASRYFRWTLSETYEYTSTGPLTWIIRVRNGIVDTLFLKDDMEFYRCWITEVVPGTFVSSTNRLTANEKKKIPLNFVSNRTDRLKFMYSLLVEQYAISEGAYKYWKQNNIAIEESGGFYTTQPGQPISNMQCINDCEKPVLGYFWVAARTERRIFTPRMGTLPVYEYDCPTYEYDPIEHRLKPRYIRVETNGKQMTGNPTCFDCRGRGGLNSKPDFWISAGED